MKRLVSILLTALLIFTMLPASAEIRMSTISQISEYMPYEVLTRDETLYSLSDYGVHLYDMETGSLLNSIKSDSTIESMAVNSDETWTALGGYYRINIYNQYLDLHNTIEESFEYNGKNYDLERFSQVKFLPDRSTLIIACNNHLIFYDVEADQVKFVRGINTSGVLQVSNDYITIGYEDSIQVLTHQGQTVTEIMASAPIQSYSINRQNKIVYNTNDNKLFVYESPLAESQSVMSNVSGKISLDETGTFVGTEKGLLYDLDTKKRIYTNAKEGIIRFNEDSSRLLEIGSSITVYNAQNLKKRIETLSIDVKADEIIEGNEIVPALLVRSKDGSQTKVTDNIVWRTSDSQVAYFSQKKLIFKAPGTFTLKATYEDHETSVELTVKKDPRPSDEEWLKQQKQSLEKRRAFLNSPHRLYTDYSKVRGVAGQFFFDDTKLISGKYQDNWLYETYNGKKKVDGMMLLLDYEKREITEEEIKKVFGKPKDTYNYSYYDSIPTKLIRGKTTLDESFISDAALYLINKKHGLIVFYDLEGNVVYLHLGESTKLW